MELQGCVCMFAFRFPARFVEHFGPLFHPDARAGQSAARWEGGKEVNSQSKLGENTLLVAAVNEAVNGVMFCFVLSLLVLCFATALPFRWRFVVRLSVLC